MYYLNGLSRFSSSIRNSQLLLVVPVYISQCIKKNMCYEEKYLACMFFDVLLPSSTTCALIMYTAISRKVVEKKHQSARDKAVRWPGYSLEFCMNSVQVCIFARREFVFPLRGLYL